MKAMSFNEWLDFKYYPGFSESASELSDDEYYELEDEYYMYRDELVWGKDEEN